MTLTSDLAAGDVPRTRRVLLRLRASRINVALDRPQYSSPEQHSLRSTIARDRVAVFLASCRGGIARKPTMLLLTGHQGKPSEKAALLRLLSPS